MEFLFELSKLYPTLPGDEVIACLDAEAPGYHLLDRNENVLIATVQDDPDSSTRLAHRLSLTNYIDTYLFSSSHDPSMITKAACQHPLPKKGSVAVRCKNRSAALDIPGLVDCLADVYTKQRTVNLSHPDLEVRAMVTDADLYVGIKKEEIDTRQFEQRKAQFRPFFSPISLHPKLARALVNISAVKKGDILLDPFCGTGGILIEAGILGIPVVGSDIEQKMVEGCEKTLNFYHIKNYRLFHCDIGEIKQHISKVDAVVTDFPYGRATTTKGEDIMRLYERAFEHIASVLKKNGRAVIGVSDKKIVSLGKRYLSYRTMYAFRVHRSLTRYFVCYEK